LAGADDIASFLRLSVGTLEANNMQIGKEDHLEKKSEHLGLPPQLFIAGTVAGSNRCCNEAFPKPQPVQGVGNIIVKEHVSFARLSSSKVSL